MKMAKCIVELERIYGVRQGSENKKGVNQHTIGESNNSTHQKNQSELAQQLGIDRTQLQNYKKLNTLIPELQELIETGQLKATTGYKIWAKMSQEEQVGLHLHFVGVIVYRIIAYQTHIHHHIKTEAIYMNDITIYSSKIARRLINENFIVVDIEENTKAGYDDKTVFSFADSKEIREFLKVIYKIHIPENLTAVT